MATEEKRARYQMSTRIPRGCRIAMHRCARCRLRAKGSYPPLLSRSQIPICSARVSGHAVDQLPQWRSVPSRDSCSATTHQLFDYLVGASKQRHWDTDAERFGGFQIDDKLKLGRRLDGQLARPFTLENTIDIRSRAPRLVDKVGAVGQQAASISVVSRSINCRHSMSRHQRIDHCSMTRRKYVGYDDETGGRIACQCGNCALDSRFIIHDGPDQLYANGRRCSFQRGPED